MSQKVKSVLVTGGAGYIGSHAAKALAAKGFIPVTYDSFVHGHRWAVQWGPLVEGDIADKSKVLETIRRYEIGAVLHFAAFASVGESIQRPERYFDNNVSKSLKLLDAIVAAGVRNVVFSSTCAIYGTPERTPISEDTIQSPINPYGETKLAFERALRWYGNVHDLSWIALRYFNAAGADPEGELGEIHSPETHLIPLALDAVLGRGPIEIYGHDYPTPDGTCVRDYIHVSDLADAHVRALCYLTNGGTSIALNLGTGQGHSVMKVIRLVEQVTNTQVPHRLAPRRLGDPPVLLADPARADKILAWRPQYSSLEYIIGTAWKWHSEHHSLRAEFPRNSRIAVSGTP